MILPATPFNTKMHFYLSLHNKKDQFSGSWPCTSNEIQNNPWQKEPFWLNQMRLLKSHVLRDHFVALSFCLKYSPGENLPPLAPRHPLYMSHLSSRLGCPKGLAFVRGSSGKHSGAASRPTQPPPNSEQTQPMRDPPRLTHTRSMERWVAVTHLAGGPLKKTA